MITRKPLFAWVLREHRGLQLLLLLLILITVFFRVLPLELQKRIVNQAIAFRRLQALLFYCGLYLGAVVLAGGLKYVINVLQGIIGQKVLLKMREDLYEHILSLPLAFFRTTPPGTVIASLTSELSAIGEFMGGALAIPITNVLTLLTFAGYMAYLNPLLALLSFSVYPLEVLVVPILQRRFNRLNQDRINLTRSMSNVINEAVSGMHEVHGNASYPLEREKLGRFAIGLYGLRQHMNVLRFGIKFVNNFFQSLGPFVLFLLGGYLTINGRLDLGALVAFLSAYEKLYDPWKELMDYYQDLQDSRVRYRQIMDCFDARPEFALLPEPVRPPLELDGDIDVQEASFEVEGNLRILDAVSLAVSPGKQLALVGLSGSGKSTLAMVIGQLYAYSPGHVLLDGRELKELSKFDVSRNIGYVPQYPFIFDGTIMENVLYACNALRENGLESAAPDGSAILGVIEAVGLSDDVLRFGLNALLERENHQPLVERLTSLRDRFFQLWGRELAEEIEFFDVDHFQYYTSLAENITFGTPVRPEYALESLPDNALFRQFLRQTSLIGPLTALGGAIAQQTVLLLRDVENDAFFFKLSPIPLEEFADYSALVEQLAKGGTDQLADAQRDALLRLALRFVPAHHKMVTLSRALEEAILQARRQFMELIARSAPDAYAFYRPTEYLHSQSILDNILFGHPKAEHPLAMDQVRQHAVDLLREEKLLDAIMAVGLEFRVGSKGDRLSGGQKQKIALARALLKRPRILILDEATASLDQSSQAKIQHLLHTELKGQCTVISVVHRLELVRDFDAIAVMKAGRIVESGTYDELLSQKGLFYDLAHGA